ncbi:NAD(P)-binding protein [Periconia macrospinosa]|uniref:NAD(P)-binding protein n=1 Tax=Periconia macrospinosa TaxID=97972 RepID=A0A2V1DWU1_9PLEO|nr:NAD(P)-binding protein [Periconia macrospinosa]
MPQLTWLITGCTSGLGEAFVRGIIARGDKVIATTRGDVSRISTLAEAGAKTFSLDVTAPRSEIDAVVQNILKENTIDVLVNNAGYVEAGLAEEVTYENYVNQFETNFFGVVKTTQALLPHFREKKSGTVVFLGSSGGLAGEPGAGPYCATKHALEGWNDVLRLETAHLGIRPIIFELGFFRTKIFNKDNLRFRTTNFSDNDPIRELVGGMVQQVDGNQPGDPAKAVSIMVDVVKGEGVAEGKAFPNRLPLGPDCLATLRKHRVNDLLIANEWEEVIRSTNFDP